MEKNVKLGAYALRNVEKDWVFFLQPTLSVTKKALSSREKAFIPKSKDYYLLCYQAIASKLSSLEQENFKFVDLSGVFDGLEAKDEIFIDQFHFGDKGNAIIANAIFSALTSRAELGRASLQKS